MFVSIDMDNLQFIHKHADHETLSALAWLELPDRSVAIENTDREHFLAKMTGLDLRLLYRNTTGLDITGTAHIVVREMLATIVEEKLKPVFVNRIELDAQVALVEDDLQQGIPWKYALGTKRPAKQDHLLALHCEPLAPNEAANAATRAPQRRAVHIATPAAPLHAPPPQPPAAAKARMPSVRPVVWAVADRLWEEAGKPMDVKVVLELRKKMMAVLESEHGVKKTSSSNELGNWMKTRIV